MNGHHLHVSLRERLIWILIFVDATFVEKTEEAVEEMKTEEFPVPIRNDCVVVVGLKYIYELREDRQITRGVLVSDCAPERLKCEQPIKIVTNASDILRDPPNSSNPFASTVSGTVVIQLVVDPSGKGRDIRVIRSLGLGLDEKAIEAVNKWKFRPGLRNGQPVAVMATIEVNFRLL